MSTLLAFGLSGALRTSGDDGSTWTARTSGTTETLFAGASKPDGSRIVVGGSGGKIITSDDAGVTWTTRTTPSALATIWTIAYGNGLWVAAGWTSPGETNFYWWSTDGITWHNSLNTGSFGTSSYANKLVYFKGTFYALGYNISAAAYSVQYSTDGNSWGTFFSSILYPPMIGTDGQKLLLTGYLGGTDLITDLITGANLGTVNPIAIVSLVGNGAGWVATGYWTGNAAGYTANADGTGWAAALHVAPSGGVTENQLIDVLWTGSHYVAISNVSGRVYVSVTGASWTEHDTGSSNCQHLAFIANSAPTASTHISPKANASIDFTQSNSFVTEFKDADIAVGDFQKAITLKFTRTLPSAAADKWWDGTNMVGTETYLVQSSGTIVVAPNKIGTNGETYQWSVKTKDQANTPGIYSSPTLILGSTPPVLNVTDPTGTITNTTRPLVEWTMTDTESSAQESYLIRVFLPAVYTGGGFDPETSTGAVWDSGKVFSSLNQAQIMKDLGLDGATTYRAYVKVFQVGDQPSNWDYSEFVVDIELPPTPTVEVIPQPSWARNRISVGGGLGSYPDGNYVVEYNDNDGSWKPLPNGLVAVPVSEAVAFYDYLAPPGIPRHYRARTVSSLSELLTVSSNTSTVEIVTLVFDDWWLKLWSDGTKNVKLSVIPPFAFKQGRAVEVFQPAGPGLQVVFDQGVRGRTGTLSVETYGEVEFQALNTLLKSTSDLLLQDPFLHQYWVHIADDYTPDLSEGFSLHYIWKIPFIEVLAPT